MPPLTRQRTIEEDVFSGIARGWAYFSYAIRQLIIFLPCLWAGYERGRRKEERMKKLKEEGGGLEQPGWNAGLFFIGSDRANWTKYEEMLWNTMEIKEDLEELLETMFEFDD
jgi:hypothetical protein